MIFVFLYFVLSLLWLEMSKLKVCLQGLQRVEEKHNDPEVLLCYLESDAQNISKPERRQRHGSFGGVMGCRGIPITLLPALEAHRHRTLPNANADGGDLWSQRKEMQLQVQPFSTVLR